MLHSSQFVLQPLVSIVKNKVCMHLKHVQFCTRNSIRHRISESANDWWIAWFGDVVTEAGIWVQNIGGKMFFVCVRGDPAMGLCSPKSICRLIIRIARLRSDWIDSDGHLSGSGARLGIRTRGSVAQRSCESTAGPLVKHLSARVASENTVRTQPWSRSRQRAVSISGRWTRGLRAIWMTSPTPRLPQRQLAAAAGPGR